jgi:hypothetical protein
VSVSGNRPRSIEHQPMEMGGVIVVDARLLLSLVSVQHN